jgi:hypothetical protein
MLDFYKKYRGYIIGAILFIVVASIYGGYQQKSQSVPQCNDPAVISTLKDIMKEHIFWTMSNFGLNLGPLNGFSEYKPVDKQIRKRYCQAMFPNGQIVQYDVQTVTVSNGTSFVVTLHAPDSE